MDRNLDTYWSLCLPRSNWHLPDFYQGIQLQWRRRVLGSISSTGLRRYESRWGGLYKRATKHWRCHLEIHGNTSNPNFDHTHHCYVCIVLSRQNPTIDCAIASQDGCTTIGDVFGRIVLGLLLFFNKWRDLMDDKETNLWTFLVQFLQRILDRIMDSACLFAFFRTGDVFCFCSCSCYTPPFKH